MFSIEWRVDQQQWDVARDVAQKAPDWARSAQARGLPYRLPLMGEVQFRENADVLFPQSELYRLKEQLRDWEVADGFPWYPIPTRSEIVGMAVTLTHLSLQLLDIMNLLHENTGNWRSMYQDAEGAIQLLFVGSNKGIEIIAWSDGPKLCVAVEEFMVGVESFLRDFVAAMDREAPGLLDLGAFARYSPFRNSSH